VEQVSNFPDHFSQAAAAYAASRPRYPPELFAALAEHAPARRLAWDCGTGSGQAAIGLARHFEQVLATDASGALLASALPHPRIRYVAALAEASCLKARSVDLVAVAQALHWFDRTAFFKEVRRVLVPRGVVAAWCYGLVEIEPAIDELVGRFYTGTVGSFWPPERRLVESGYRTVDFPFERFTLPPMWIETPLTLGELGDYIRTWSATLRYRAAFHRDPVGALLESLQPSWGPPGRRRSARWPLAVRAGYSAAGA